VLTLMGIHYLDLNAISLAFHANLYNSLRNRFSSSEIAAVYRCFPTCGLFPAEFDVYLSG